MAAAGDRILGSYRLLDQLGKGATGEVYRGVHLRLGSARAIKVLPVNLANEPDFLRRFEREAASIARLDHPNILPVYDYGEEGGIPFIVMPYVTGGSLQNRLAQGLLPHAEVLRYVGQMAEALDYAHEQGIIHRDVKPANMILDGQGRLYLADFGVARALEGTEGAADSSVGVGTPEYMAPEQAQGRADERSDLYAMGIILYQMLAGRVPFSGNNAVEVLMQHLQDPPPMQPLRAANLPPAVERVVEKALRKNPHERYRSGKALVADLEQALARTPTAGASTAPHPAFAPRPIFLSYRRADSADHTARLYDALCAQFGAEQIFLDVDTIEPGMDFVDVLGWTLASCSVLLAIIGQDWLTAIDDLGRRLDNPEDFVRLELAAALVRDILVIPVLLQGTAMPRAQDLPEPLRGLARRQALELRDQRWWRDTERLIAIIGRALAR